MQIKTLIKLPLAVALFALPVVWAHAGTTAADAAMKRDFPALAAAVEHDGVGDAQADGSTALHWAVHWGNADAVDRLLKAGADPNAATRLGATPLYLASLSGDARIVKKLLKAGAHPNARILSNQETALMFAARSGSVDTVRLLLDAGAEINAHDSYKETTALMWAAEQNQAGVVALLLKHGADPAAVSKLTIEERRNSALDIINGASPDPETFYVGAFTALDYAARENGVAAVKALLDARVPVDQRIGDGSTPLMLALQNGHVDLAHLLLERGADANASNRKGWTPLFLAVKIRNQEMGTMPNRDATGMFGVIEQLVAKGADVNARLIGRTEVHDAIASTWLKEEGATALLRASWCGDLDVIKLLLAHGADPNITTKDGTTALMALAGVGYAEGFIKDYGGRAESAEAMKLLIKAGADVNAKNAEKVTALHGAAHKNFVEAIQILVDNGADLSAQSLWRKIPATPLDWAIGVRIGGSSTIYRTEAVALITKLLDERHITASARSVYPNNMRGG